MDNKYSTTTYVEKLNKRKLQRTKNKIWLKVCNEEGKCAWKFELNYANYNKST